MTICVLQCILKGFFSEGILYQTFFGYKSKFLKKMYLKFGPNRIKDNTVSIR